MMVVKRELVSNLYKLIDETLVGEAIVASTKLESLLSDIGIWDVGILFDKDFLPNNKFAFLNFCKDYLFGK